MLRRRSKSDPCFPRGPTFVWGERRQCLVPRCRWGCELPAIRTYLCHQDPVDGQCKIPHFWPEGSENTGFMIAISGPMGTWSFSLAISKPGTISRREDLFPKWAGELCYDFLPRALWTTEQLSRKLQAGSGVGGAPPDGAVSRSGIAAPRLEALYVTMPVALAVNPSMGSVASKIQRGSTKPALLSSSGNYIWNSSCS